MGKMTRVIPGTFEIGEGKIALVAARYNESIVENLIVGAQNAFISHGLTQERLTLIRVPGAYELPFATQKILQTDQYVGVLALGAVIRGLTPHFEYVAQCCAQGLMDVQLKENSPVAFGVLTTYNLEQALERADPARGNKGGECAVSLLEMIYLVDKIRE